MGQIKWITSQFIHTGEDFVFCWSRISKFKNLYRFKIKLTIDKRHNVVAILNCNFQNLLLIDWSLGYSRTFTLEIGILIFQLLVNSWLHYFRSRMNNFTTTTDLILILILMAYSIETITTHDKNGKISRMLLLCHFLLALYTLGTLAL